MATGRYENRTKGMVTRWIAGSLIAVSHLSVLVPQGIVFEISSWSQNPAAHPTIPPNYPNDGQILRSKPWRPLANLDSLDDFTRNYFPKAVYEEARSQKDFDVLEITYSSDGVPVNGMLIKPKIPGGHKWPAIIFNRGGTGDYSRITSDGITACSQTNPVCLTVVDLYQFSKAGICRDRFGLPLPRPNGKA